MGKLTDIARLLLCHNEVSESGLRSLRILIDPDSDSVLKISAPTPTPTPFRLRATKRHPTLKRAIQCRDFLDFTFDCIQTGDTAKQHPFALTADAAGRGVVVGRRSAVSELGPDVETELRGVLCIFGSRGLCSFVPKFH